MDKNAPESVHLCDFPAVDESMIDTRAGGRHGLVLKVVVLGRAARNGANHQEPPAPGRHVRQGRRRRWTSSTTHIIADELNVKKVTFTDDVSAFTNYTFKPQLKTLGPK